MPLTKTKQKKTRKQKAEQTNTQIREIQKEIHLDSSPF
jgi:hypothetical protein